MTDRAGNRAPPVIGEPGRSLPSPVALTISEPGGAALTRSSQRPSPTWPATGRGASRVSWLTAVPSGSAQAKSPRGRVVSRCRASPTAVPPAPRQMTCPSASGQIRSATRPAETGSRAQPCKPPAVRRMALTSSQARASGSRRVKSARPALPARPYRRPRDRQQLNRHHLHAGNTGARPVLALCAELPEYRIWREPAAERTVYYSRSRDLRTNPYAVVTDDLDELARTLREARAARQSTSAGPQ